MNAGSTADAGWFEGLDRGDLDGGSEAIESGLPVAVRHGRPVGPQLPSDATQAPLFTAR